MKVARTVLMGATPGNGRWLTKRINTLTPQPSDGTKVSQNAFDSARQKQTKPYLSPMGDSSDTAGHSDSLNKTIVPHTRTLRNAREQVKQMVNDGVSLPRIKSYLHRR